MKKLSVMILARNEERNIVDCLNSVRWAAERLVVDSGSTDRTVELARSAGATVLQLPWMGYGETKNKALDKTTGEWILWLDADERVTDALAEEIQGCLGAERIYDDAYSVPRRAFFLGRWIRHAGWYPGYVVRLFRKGAARFTVTRVHEGLAVEGSVGWLRNDLIHLTDPDLGHYFDKFNRYTSLAAQDLVSSGTKFRVWQLLVRPLFSFFKMYVLRQGWRDGIHGFVLCALSACYVFVKYAKLWEQNLPQSKEGN